jgi:hypothetical protein
VTRRCTVTFEQMEVDALKEYLQTEKSGALPPQLRSSDPEMLQGVLDRINAHMAGAEDVEFTSDEADELDALGDACHQYAILMKDPAAMQPIVDMGTCLHGVARSMRASIG